MRTKSKLAFLQANTYFFNVSLRVDSAHEWPVARWHDSIANITNGYHLTVDVATVSCRHFARVSV